jgi:Carbohydrate-selective porin, OprB family/S-layer homology domain
VVVYSRTAYDKLNIHMIGNLPICQNICVSSIKRHKMNKLSKNIFLASTFAINIFSIFMISRPSFSQVSKDKADTSEYTSEYTSELPQVTSVSQLSDVQPTDWAFQALQSLVERYGCIAGYPNGTFRGNRAITRYEFAAGLNACLERVQELIVTARNNLATRQDLNIIRKLQEEFSAELATLRSRVDTLEAKTAELEANQFSTTTKLEGEAIFTIAGVFGDSVADADNNPNNNQKLDSNIILANRVRLNLLTSFTGKDELNIRLESGNLIDFDDGVTGTPMTRLGFDEDTGNDVGLDEVYYAFPIGERIKVTLAVHEMELNDIAEPLNPLESSGSGAISRFGRYNPILRSIEGTGLGINYQLNKSTNIAVAYLSNDAAIPTEKNGLFDGNYAALGNITFQPTKNLGIAFNYIHSYYAGGGESGVNLTGSTGSLTAIRPFGNVSTMANSFSLETSFRVNPKFIISGWVGYTKAESQVSNDDADILNYAVSLALPDLGGKGNLAGFVLGMPPKVISSTQVVDRGTSFHIEGFYRFQLSDNISLTPGLFVITNPQHNDNNSTIFVGAVRTTFEF